MTETLTIQFWGDLICPVCPVGHAMLKAGIAQFPHRDRVEIVYRSSRLRPGVPPLAVNSYLQQQYGADADVASILGQVEQMGADAGLTYKMANTLAGDTMDAHRVVHFAKSHGLDMQTVEHLHSAHFAEEANIFDKDTLVRLAGEVGLDRNEVASMLAENTFKNDIEADEAAAQDVGASSVPFFLIRDRFPIQGKRSFSCV
jgi:predicted DsbA family dithiol-disulfide isomerase